MPYTPIMEFCVDLVDPDYDEDDENAPVGPDGETPVTTLSVKLRITDEEYYAILDANEALVDHIETTYGTLDIQGDNDGYGFSSHEIELKDADAVFAMLCGMFEKYIVRS